MYKAPGFLASIPAGGLRTALPGGNTVGGWIREERPRADGYRHVDTPAMIETLRRIGANHYLFGIWDAPTDWEDLRDEFAPAAQAAGLQLMPYLVPPSETADWGRASRPFQLDYLGWAEAIAELSREYPALTAWAIDDFDIGENAETFTDAYLTEIREAQFAINPDLGFLTCAYYASATNERFYQRYGRFIDGVIFPYLDGRNLNTVVADRVRRDLREIREVAADHDVATLFLVYTGRFLDGLLAPTESYVADCIGAGLDAVEAGDAIGVIAYGMQVDGAPTVSNERRSMYGDGRGAILSSHAAVPAGAYAELACTIDVDPAAPRHELSFWHSRDTQLWRVPRRGDYLIEVLIDDARVWRADLHDDTWMGLWIQGHSAQGPFEVTEALRGRTVAELTLRVTAQRDLRNSSFDVGFDHLESIGFTVGDPGFEDPSQWRTSGSGDPIVATVDVFEPDRPARILEAVAHCYRRDADAGALEPGRNP